MVDKERSRRGEAEREGEKGKWWIKREVGGGRRRGRGRGSGG